MEKFSVHKSLIRDVATFAILGCIDETSKFPGLQDPKIKEVKIDLNGVKNINSIGTRAWILWVSSLGTTPITASYIPATMIKVFNLVLGAKPSNMQIQSFYVPYFSTNSRKDVLFTKGKDFNDAGEVNAPDTLTEDGVEYEIDVLPTYFKFLKS